MNNLIIMTTAITRPNLHVESIGEFYKKVYEKNKKCFDEMFKVSHIINIDHPDKLKEYFTIEETIDNFKKIIPSNVNLQFLFSEPDNPSFLDAFKRIMDYVDNMNLYENTNNLFWWLEDDWKFIENTNMQSNNLFQILNFLTNFNLGALTITANSQLGSFRGGPIMTQHFFLKYFNIKGLGMMNNSCDPERQVVNYISMKGIKMENGIVMKREILNEKIRLILIYIDVDYSKFVPDFGYSFYQKKFNTENNFNYEFYIINIKSHSWNIFEFLQLSENNLLNYSYCTNKKNYKQTTLMKFKQLLNSNKLNCNTTINYFIVKPFCLEDCGRDFALRYNLIKNWIKYGDKTTYS